MKSCALLLLGLVVPLVLRAEEEETRESMIAGVRANLAAYESIAAPKADVPVSVHIKLGETVSKYRDQTTYDGIRITAPDDVAERDFVWYFNAPKNWGNWYIIPAAGDFEGGFEDWLNADKLYRDLDKPQEKDRTRALQTLDKSYFKAGAEYILWFRQVKPDDGAATDLRAVFRFVARPGGKKEWDHASIEKALKLKDAPDADQVAELNSRGGRIMLDTKFFDKSDASSRIHNVLFNIRQTKQYDDGVFITMEASSPPCRASPSLADIRAKYGPADFVQTAEEARKITRHRGNEPNKDDDKPVTTHYYDYFAFEVADSDADEKVIHVKTHGIDFAELKPSAKGGSFGMVPMKNLTTLYQDGKEVGRLYYFMEGGKEPLVAQEPPVGKYQHDDMTLEYQGGGSWLFLTEAEGRPVRRIPLVGNRFHGMAEGFYPDGKPSFNAPYKDGKLHGEVIQYSEQGKVSERQHYIEGKQVKDAPRKGPAKAAEPQTKPKPL
ncbi:MAG: hypothetical protein JWR15_4681 [Prosthecobacter sp.]|nr:hypothetical protein [Prosthecobacter sp.]